MLGPRLGLMRSGSMVLLAAALALPGAAQDVCRFLPAGSTEQVSALEDFERQAGLVAKCTALYPEGQVSLMVFNGPEVPAREVANLPATDPRSTPQTIDGLGDSSVELVKEQNPPGNPDSPVRYKIQFARGCHAVHVNAGGALGANYILDESGNAEWNARRNWARATANSIDALLKNEPPCPGQTTTTNPPIVQPGGLGVIASCQVDSATGDATCTATATDAKPDASITYSWTFDNAPQGITAAELPLTAVSFGDHVVTVVANDSVNQLSSPSQTVTFSRYSSSVGGGGGGGGGGSGIPIGPIVITTVIATGGLAGIGWAIARRRRKPASPPLVPFGNEPLGAPPLITPPSVLPEKPERPPPQPPSVLPEKPERKPPAEAKPVLPPPVARRPPPPEKFTPPVVAAPPVDARGHRDGDVWLEAAQAAVRVLGDNTSEVVVTVVARQRSGALTLDASNEVTPSWMVSDPKRVTLTQRGGYCSLAVRGLHAGNVPATATITITGVSSLGRPVRPATIGVTIDPLAIEVRITVAKKGFVEKTYVTTLPDVVRAVHGRVDGGVVHPRGNQPTRLPVAFARCEASLRFADGAWSDPVRLESASDGTFRYDLPRETVLLYQAVTDHHIPSAIELGWTQEVLDAMRGYGQAWLDFRHNLERLPGGKDYAALDEPLDKYRDTFATQLREREEADFPRAVAGIHLLRANLVFATKYRNDVFGQRRVVDFTAQEFLSSAFDVFTDFVDVAAVIFGWVKAGGSLLRSGATDRLAALVDVLDKVPGSGLAARASLVALRVLRVPVETFEEGVESLITAASRLAGETGIPQKFVQKISWIGEDPGELVEGGLWKVAKSSFWTVWELAMVLAKRVLFGGMKTGLALLHIAVLVLCAAGKTLVTLMRELSWGEDSTWTGAILERIEYEMGESIGKIYESFGLMMDKLCGRFYYNQLVGEPPSSLSQKSLADIVLDAITTLPELDRKCAVEMKRAYEMALALDFGADWQMAIREVSSEERRAMEVLERREKLFYDVGFVADLIKLAMKVLQAIVFTWSVSSVGVLKLIRWGVGMLGDAGRAFKETVEVVSKATEEIALGFYKKLERLVDLCDLISVRTPILMMEVLVLYFLTEVGPSRMRALCEKGRRP